MASPPPRWKPCSDCGHEFLPTRDLRNYCSTQCSERRQHARTEENNARKKRLREEIRPLRKCAYAPCQNLVKRVDPRKIYCSKKCTYQARYRRNLVKSREYNRKRYAKNREAILARLKQKYSLRPEKKKEKERHYRRDHRDEINRRRKEAKAQQRATLAEARRIIALSAQNIGHKTNKTKPSTDARITLAASLLLDDLRIYAIKDELFPKQHNAENRYNSMKQLIRRYRARIDDEKNRLVNLPPAERTLAVTSARRLL